MRSKISQHERILEILRSDYEWHGRGEFMEKKLYKHDSRISELLDPRKTKNPPPIEKREMVNWQGRKEMHYRLRRPDPVQTFIPLSTTYSLR